MDIGNFFVETSTVLAEDLPADSRGFELTGAPSVEDGTRIEWTLSVEIPRKRGRGTHVRVDGYGDTPEAAREFLRTRLRREYNLSQKGA